MVRGSDDLPSVTELVDGPQPVRQQDSIFKPAFHSRPVRAPVDEFDVVALGGRTTRHPEAVEPFHWKGLLLQSFSFELLQHATRIMTADQNDRHILLNRPFWSDYWASAQQFNMRRWNDGDSIKVNYIGHPMQGAISGYIEVQNDPRGRTQEISRSREYWRSRFRAFLWNTVYSTQWEIGPLGETADLQPGRLHLSDPLQQDILGRRTTAKIPGQPTPTTRAGWTSSSLPSSGRYG